jgi:hypothetical protein
MLRQSYILKLQCLSVCLSLWAVLGRFFQSLPFPVECFGGWGKGEPGETWGWGGQHGRGREGTGGKGPGGGGGGTGGQGPGEGELDGCIMHRVHTINI